jgi:hypothetical protein
MSTDFQQLKSGLQVTSYTTGNKSTAGNAAWVDMRDSLSILAVATVDVVATDGGIESFVLQGSSASGGANPVTIKSVEIATGTEPDTAGDQVVLEATQEEIAAAGTDIRYVSARLENASATDRVVVTYIRQGRHEKLGLTADLRQ